MVNELTESDVLRIAAKLSKKLDKEVGKKASGVTVDRIINALAIARGSYLKVSVER